MCSGAYGSSFAVAVHRSLELRLLFSLDTSGKENFGLYHHNPAAQLRHPAPVKLKSVLRCKKVKRFSPALRSPFLI